MVSVTAATQSLTHKTNTSSVHQDAEVARKFEAAMLSPLVDEMLRSGGEEFMGGGQSAGLWRSFMAGAISEEIAKTNTTGIAAMVEQQLAAYRK